jgi:hypothetical protein
MHTPATDEPMGGSPFDPAERARRSAALTLELTLAPLLTGAAALCGWASARRIRGLVPDYPQQASLLAYQPNPVYRALHLFGTPGLLALLVLGLAAMVALGWSRFRWASTAMLGLCIVHLALLTAALLGYGLSATNFAGALIAGCAPGR